MHSVVIIQCHNALVLLCCDDDAVENIHSIYMKKVKVISLVTKITKMAVSGVYQKTGDTCEDHGVYAPS